MSSVSDSHARLGLSLALDFITAEQQQALIAQIRDANPTKKRNITRRNTIQRYGSREPYFDNLVSDVIPAHLAELCDRLVALNLVAARPDSVTINEYYAGQFIAPHIDHIDAGPVITILSLGSPATMIFSQNGDQFSVELPPRSITQMRDQIRYGWNHEIAPVKDLRYSLVFRDSASCRRKV